MATQSRAQVVAREALIAGRTYSISTPLLSCFELNSLERFSDGLEGNISHPFTSTVPIVTERVGLETVTQPEWSSTLISARDCWVQVTVSIECTELQSVVKENSIAS